MSRWIRSSSWPSRELLRPPQGEAGEPPTGSVLVSSACAGGRTATEPDIRQLVSPATARLRLHLEVISVSSISACLMNAARLFH